MSERVERGEDEDRGDLPRRKQKQGSVAWLWILLGCGGVALLGCVVAGGAAALLFQFRSSTAAGAANPRVEQIPGLIAYWSCDEVKDNKIADHSGRNHNLTLKGGRIDQGVRGSALWLDGPADQFAELPGSADFNFGGDAPFTFSAWFKTPAASACILSLTSSKGPQQIDMLVRDNRFICVVGDDNDTTQQNAFVWSKVRNDGAWHHFVLSRRGNVVRLWIDNALQGEMAAAKSGGPVTTDLRALGSERGWITKNDQRWGNPSFQGGIDEVCVFNRAIEPAEIQILFEH